MVDAHAPLQPRLRPARAEVLARGGEVAVGGGACRGEDLRVAAVLGAAQADVAAKLQRQAPRALLGAVQADARREPAVLRQPEPARRDPPDARDGGEGRRGRAGAADSRRDSQHHAPQRHRRAEGHLDGAVAPEAAQQHDSGRHHHLRGVPGVPQVRHEPRGVLARVGRGRDHARAPRVVRAPHRHGAPPAPDDQDGAHQGLHQLPRHPQVRAQRRGPRRVHPRVRARPRRREPRAELRPRRAGRRRGQSFERGRRR